jgi:hypothetical protein
MDGAEVRRRTHQSLVPEWQTSLCGQPACPARPIAPRSSHIFVSRGRQPGRYRRQSPDSRARKRHQCRQTVEREWRRRRSKWQSRECKQQQQQNEMYNTTMITTKQQLNMYLAIAAGRRASRKTVGLFGLIDVSADGAHVVAVGERHRRTKRQYNESCQHDTAFFPFFDSLIDVYRRCG